MGSNPTRGIARRFFVDGVRPGPGIPMVEDAGSEPVRCGFESHPRHLEQLGALSLKRARPLLPDGPVVQLVEAADLKSVCCGFEPHLGHLLSSTSPYPVILHR